MCVFIRWGQKWVVRHWHKEEEEELVSRPESGSPGGSPNIWGKVQGPWAPEKAGGGQNTHFLHDSSGFLEEPG